MGPVIRNVIRDVIRPVMGDEALVSRFTPAATDYFNRLGALRVTAYDAANAALIDRLVGNGGNFWPASGAFCAMAGYLYPGNGANLIPLKDGHDAGTLNAFVTGDWNAVTGLKGDGSTKYVNSNRNNNADGQNDQAMGGFVMDQLPEVAEDYATIGAGGDNTGASQIVTNYGTVNDFRWTSRSRNGTAFVNSQTLSSFVGYMGVSRSTSSGYLNRFDGSNVAETRSSQVPFDENIYVFARNKGGAGAFTPNRLPFYHIGPNLNGAGELAELDAALTEWKNALAAA